MVAATPITLGKIQGTNCNPLPKTSLKKRRPPKAKNAVYVAIPVAKIFSRCSIIHSRSFN
ncbi:MAG: hypothetical protein ACJAS9_002913, partial [Polaribacter sp.]